MPRIAAAALLLVACTRSSPNPGQPPAQPKPQAMPQEEANNCEPLPKEGAPCREGDSYCVVDWGDPGGWSTALWCRDGRWEIEKEANLPEDDG